MSSARANANQALYLAKIQHRYWRVALDAEDVPQITLNQAFLPAVAAHLQRAYGWFLLELTGAERVLDDAPPLNVAQLPPVAEGKAVSGELRELQQLEQTGFLAGVLSQQCAAAAAPVSGEIAAVQQETPDFADVEVWIEEFAALCERMRNSLDEY